MSFLIAQWELPENGLMRVIGEQAEKLVKECEKASEDPAAFAHKARVRCKKIRAALRLAEAADKGNMAEAAVRLGEVVSGCVACHQMFRGQPGISPLLLPGARK
mgnify:CR=1 FL=1